MTENSEILTLGVDLGGTKIETALVDAIGRIVVSHWQETHSERGPDRVISDVVISVKTCLNEAGKKVGGLGVGMAGQVDRAGIVRFSPNLNWRNVPLKARLEEMLGMSVVVNNDVRAAALGEWRHGAGRGVNNLVCLFVGTGIGGGIVSGGRLLEGANNSAGELGHLTLVSGGRNCHCPNRGCLEAYAGGWAIAERARERVLAEPQAGRRLVALAGGIEQISAATVAQACGESDPLACGLVEETGRYLAAGVVGIVNVFNPALLILGGSVIYGLPGYISTVESAIRENALLTAAESLRVVKAALGDKAGVIGAAALVRDRIKEMA